MDFVILGRTALYRDGRSVDLGAAKQRALLALLLFHARTAVRVDTLVEHLWGDPPTARSNLYALVSRTRRVLDRVGRPDALARVDSGGAYRLDVDPGLVDFHRFRRLVAAARKAPDAAPLLVEATGLWRGEPLADLRGPYAEQLRRHMNDELVDAHKLLADCQLRLGQPDVVLERLEPFMLERHFDLDERLADLWIRALTDVGRVDDARAHLVQFRKRFRRQLRAEPQIEMPTTVGSVGGRISGRGGGGGVRVGGGVGVGPVAPVAVPRQLPLDVVDFTGHEDLLREIDDATDRTNLVVLSGMPGIGKTTLAIHWAHRHRDRFPDGQLYLNANAFGTGPAVEPVRALGRFLTALGVASDHMPGDADARRELFNDLVADRRMVFVLDNVGSTDQVRPLIPTTGPGVTLVTSRNRLRGLSIREAARCVTVPPLPARDSTALLTGVIGASRAAADPDGVRDLVRLTGGLPLALRIVGEHVAERAHMPVADLAVEFSRHRLGSDLLGSDGDDEEARLETVFAWSFDALEPAAARVFRLLGLFPGPTVSAEAVAAMAAEPLPTVHMRLRGLARAHLISHDAGGRFRMHDLLKRYAADRAADPTSDPTADPTLELRPSAVRRLLDWYLWSMIDAARVLAPDRPRVPDLSEPVGVTPQTFASDAEAVAWCGAERTNLGPVTRQAVDDGLYRTAWQLVGTAHELYDRYGRQDEVLEFCALGLEAARLDGHRDGELGTLVNQGSTFFAMRDHEHATESFTAALRLARDSDDPDAPTVCLHNLGSVHLATGRIAAAVEAFTEVLAMCRRTGNTVGESSTLHRLGTAYRRLGRSGEAADHYREALAIRSREHAVRGQAETLAALAALFQETGDLAGALAHGREAIDLAARMHDDVVRCDALMTVADVELASGRPDEAERDAREAADIAREIGDQLRLGHALRIAGSVVTAATGASAAAGIRAAAGIPLNTLPPSWEKE